MTAYNYYLPKELIAQTPIPDRAGSRLLDLDRMTGEVKHRAFRESPDLLQPGDLLVLNETRVTAVRLSGRLANSSSAAEVLVLKRMPSGPYLCMTKPARRLKLGTRLEFRNLSALVVGIAEQGLRHIEFDHPERIEDVGEAPLPPYIKAKLEDRTRYQTVYARSDREDGSAAAPTAGLHFTEDVLAEVERKGVRIVKVNLQVGLDTFRPVQTEALDDHEMHGEVCLLPEETAHAIAETRGRIVAVGTTTVRTLESFARAPGAVGRRLIPGCMTSKLFLRPGSEFKLVDAFFTNFHLPRTTMLVMLSAFAGRIQVLAAYDEAVRHQYRFLSFGDAMFLH